MIVNKKEMLKIQKDMELNERTATSLLEDSYGRGYNEGLKDGKRLGVQAEAQKASVSLAKAVAFARKQELEKILGIFKLEWDFSSGVIDIIWIEKYLEKRLKELE